MRFHCYLHASDTFKPRVEVIDCDGEAGLSDEICSHMAAWMPFQMIEVYNPGGERVMCVASDTPQSRH